VLAENLTLSCVGYSMVFRQPFRDSNMLTIVRTQLSIGQTLDPDILHFHQYKSNFCPSMLLFFSCCIRVNATSWFEP